MSQEAEATVVQHSISSMFSRPGFFWVGSEACSGAPDQNRGTCGEGGGKGGRVTTKDDVLWLPERTTAFQPSGSGQPGFPSVKPDAIQVGEPLPWPSKAAHGGSKTDSGKKKCVLPAAPVDSEKRIVEVLGGALRIPGVCMVLGTCLLLQSAGVLRDTTCAHLGLTSSHRYVSARTTAALG